MFSLLHLVDMCGDCGDVTCNRYSFCTLSPEAAKENKPSHQPGHGGTHARQQQRSVEALQVVQAASTRGLRDIEQQLAEVAPALARVSAALRIEALPGMRAMAPQAKQDLLVRTTATAVHYPHAPAHASCKHLHLNEAVLLMLTQHHIFTHHDGSSQTSLCWLLWSAARSMLQWCLPSTSAGLRLAVRNGSETAETAHA